MKGISKSCVLLALIMVTISSSLDSTITEARTLSSIPAELSSGRSKIYATLGIECKCCDGEECTTKWEGSCSKLQCQPWKQNLPSIKPLFSH